MLLISYDFSIYIKILIALNILHVVLKLLVNPQHIVVTLGNSEEKHHTAFS